MKQEPSNQLLFILGLPRSGTTLLNTLLNQHSRIALMKECNLCAFPARAFHRNSYGKMLQRLEAYSKAVSFHELESYTASEEMLSRTEACRKTYSIYAQANDSGIGGEKSPSYHWIALNLSRAFPEARFIVILRPLEEIFRSYLRMARSSRHMRRRGRFSALLRGQEHIFKFLSREESRSRVFTTTYARLVDDSETTLRGICEFLKIDFESAMKQLPTVDSISETKNKAHLKWGNLLSDTVERRRYGDYLSEKIESKIQRYRIDWGRRYPEHYRLIYDEVPTGKPLSILEKTLDQLSAEGHESFNRFAVWFFGFCPLSLLHLYRKLRPLPYEPITRGS